MKMTIAERYPILTILAIVACLTLGALSLVYGPTTPKLW